MTKIDLITGFLGAGKTTFLKHYIKYLLSKGEKICVLENDYGAINIDMMLLQEFQGRIDMEMVAGGCDYDCHIRRFKTKLIAMGMKKYDRVIIEPSGIYDTDEFFDALYEEPLDSWYEIGSVIMVIDSNTDNLSEMSEYVLMNELRSAGSIIISKTEDKTKEETESFVQYLDTISKKYGLTLYQDKILRKPYLKYSDTDYEAISHSGYHDQPFNKRQFMDNNDFKSIYFMNLGLSLKVIREKAEILFNEKKYGDILRIKGFIQEKNTWSEFNMTKDSCTMNSLKEGQDVFIVIGEHLNEEEIKELFQ